MTPRAIKKYARYYDIVVTGYECDAVERICAGLHLGTDPRSRYQVVESIVMCEFADQLFAYADTCLFGRAYVDSARAALVKGDVNPDKWVRL